jgi:hypothetical protein
MKIKIQHTNIKEFPYGNLNADEMNFIMENVGTVINAERYNMNYYIMENGYKIHVYDAVETEGKKKMYNHMFDVAFSIESDRENPDDVSVEDLLKGLKKRFHYLVDNPEEAREAFGYSDSYEI